MGYWCEGPRPWRASCRTAARAVRSRPAAGGTRVCRRHRRRERSRRGSRGGRGALLVPEVDRARAVAEDRLPAPRRGRRERPGVRARHPRQQPPVVHRLAVHAADPAAPGHVRGQGGVLHHPRASRAGSRRSSSPAPARCRSTGPVPTPPRAPSRRRARSSSRVTSSASTPRARARTTAGSTAARPASPGWRSRPRVPVIPVAVLGTDVVAPPGKTFGTFTRPGVRFGKPLDFSRYEGMENDRYILRAITDEIMYEIMQLSGQEYVDTLRRRKAKELSQKSATEAKRAEREAATSAPVRRAEAGVLTRPRGVRLTPGLRGPADGAGRDRGRGPHVPVARGAPLRARRQRRRPQHLPRRLLPPGAPASLLVGVMVVWTCVISWVYHSYSPTYDGLGRRRPGGRPGRRSRLTAAVKEPGYHSTVPGFWIMAAMFAWAIHWRVVSAAWSRPCCCRSTDFLTRHYLSETVYGNLFLLLIGGPIVGLMVDSLLRSAARTAAAERAAAAAAERTRLARAVHDGVLQVLALVQRRGPDLGTEGAELGTAGWRAGARPAGADPAAGRRRPDARDGRPGRRAVGARAPARRVGRRALGRRTPGAGPVADEIVAVVSACLDNVVAHVGPSAPAWVLLEATPDAVLVTVRDEGPGHPGRTARGGRARGAAWASRRRSAAGWPSSAGGRAVDRAPTAPSGSSPSRAEAGRGGSRPGGLHPTWSGTETRRRSRRAGRHRWR